jgi:hypothetical protein
MNLSSVLCPVAKAVAADAESVMTESAAHVETDPFWMLSKFNGSPLYHRAIVCVLNEQPSGTSTITFLISRLSSEYDRLSPDIAGNAKIENRAKMIVAPKI